MKREAFKMYLKPGCEAEYEKRHAAIWPELKALLSQNGVSDYSIYWDKETNILFAFQKTEGGAGSQDLGNTEIVQKWWARYDTPESAVGHASHAEEALPCGLQQRIAPPKSLVKEYQEHPDNDGRQSNRAYANAIPALHNLPHK